MAIPGNRHEDGQTEPIGDRTRFTRHTQRGRGTARVLGHDRPRSEGNLASDIDNTAQPLVLPLQEKPEKTAEKPAEKTARESSAPAEKAERTERPPRGAHKVEHAAPERTEHVK